MQSIAPIHRSEERRKEQLSECNAVELNDFRNFTGKLSWLGHGVLP